MSGGDRVFRIRYAVTADLLETSYIKRLKLSGTEINLQFAFNIDKLYAHFHDRVLMLVELASRIIKE